MTALHKIVRIQAGASAWLRYAALLTGLCIVFLSVQLYMDANDMLSHSRQKKDGYDYLVVNKKITNAMMGDNTNSFFTTTEIEELKKQKAVDEVGLITSNRYGITANTLGQLAFSTQLFFESVQNDYLDITPENWQWKEGDAFVPVILSADYINLYNFGFALSQGLPQLSEETIKAIPFNVTIYDKQHEATFVAHVVGFTQRYSSVLVPETFMKYANDSFGSGKPASTSRIILRTKEADQPALVQYLQDQKYATQNEKLKGSQLKSIVNMIFATCGFFGLFVLLLSSLLMLLYLKLMIIQSAAKLQLLTMLGYKRSTLQTLFTKTPLRIFMSCILLALLITAGIQYAASVKLNPLGLVLTPLLSWATIVVALLTGLTIYFLFTIKIKKVIAQITGSYTSFKT